MRVIAHLFGEPQFTSCIDSSIGRAIHPINIDVDLAAGLIFLFETCAMAFLCREKETIDSRKIGVEAFLSADGLDTVHGRDLAVVVDTRLIFTAHADELAIEMVKIGRKVRGSARRHSVSYRAAINDDDRAAGRAKMVSPGQ